MRKLKKWWSKRPMIDKIILIGIPLIFLVSFIAIRMVMLDVVNGGKELPLPSIAQDTGRVNLDTLADRKYKVDILKAQGDLRKKDTTQIVLRSNLVPSSYISNEDEGQLVDDKPRTQENTEKPVVNSDQPQIMTPLATRSLPVRQISKRGDLYVPPVPINEKTTKTVQRSVPSNDDGFNILRSSGAKASSSDPGKTGDENTDSAPGEKPVSAIVNGNQVVSNGGRLSIKLTQNGMLKDLKVASGTVLWAKVVINDNRVTALFDRITINGRVYPTALTALDIDFQEGLAFDLGKTGGNNNLKETGGNILDRVVNTASKGIITGGSDAIRKSGGLKENTVPLKNGRKLYLVSM